MGDIDGAVFWSWLLPLWQGRDALISPWGTQIFPATLWLWTWPIVPSHPPVLQDPTSSDQNHPRSSIIPESRLWYRSFVPLPTQFYCVASWPHPYLSSSSPWYYRRQTSDRPACLGSDLDLYLEFFLSLKSAIIFCLRSLPTDLTNFRFHGL